MRFVALVGALLLVGSAFGAPLDGAFARAFDRVASGAQATGVAGGYVVERVGERWVQVTALGAPRAPALAGPAAERKAAVLYHDLRARLPNEVQLACDAAGFVTLSNVPRDRAADAAHEAMSLDGVRAVNVELR